MKEPSELGAPDIERYIKPWVFTRESSEVQINARINGKYSDFVQTEGDPRLIYNRHDATLECCLEASLEPYVDVYLNDSCASESQRTTTTPCPRTTTHGEQYTPDIHISPPSFLDANAASIANKDNDALSAFVFADRASGVVFSSGLIRASGDRVTAHEFRKARGLAPTLHIVIPTSSPAALAATPTSTTKEQQQEEDSTSCYPSPPLPSFALTLASPITSPRSPIHPHPPTPKPFTRASYYAQVARAPRRPNRNNNTRRIRIPYLPQYCAHTLRPFIPLTNTDCPLCAIQLLACETWWNSRNTNTHTHTPSSKLSGLAVEEGGRSRSRSKSMRVRMLCAPQVLPADCTPTTRAIFYALGLPLGRLDESCVDWDVVDAIMFIPSFPPCRKGSSKMAAAARGSSSSRIHVLFRRARHFFSTPARVLKMARH